MGLQMLRFSLLLKKNQKSFAITWSFQCIFSIAIINSTFNVLLLISGVRRNFPRGWPNFVTIVWRHKSTLREVPKARPFKGSGACPRENFAKLKYAFLCYKFLPIFALKPKNTHFCAFWKQVLDITVFTFLGSERVAVAQWPPRSVRWCF